MLPLIWLGIAVVLGIIEAMAPMLVCLWFCLGAIVAFVVSLFIDNILIEVIVFVAVSLLALIALRPLMKKRVNAKDADALTDVDTYVGRDVVVTQGIQPGQNGRVRLSDVSWLARTNMDVTIEAGAHARVVKVEGTVLVVEPV